MIRKILVVDDEPFILDIMEQAFDRAGYVVRRAESAEEAQRLLGQEEIPVMFLDLNLPGMSGADLCRQIRKDKPMSIIFALTGDASRFDVSGCREAGFDDYFTKPMDLTSLYDAAQGAFSKLKRWK